MKQREARENYQNFMLKLPKENLWLYLVMVIYTQCFAEYNVT